MWQVISCLHYFEGWYEQLHKMYPSLNSYGIKMKRDYKGRTPMADLRDAIKWMVDEHEGNRPCFTYRHR
jgi:hypothetical protein